MDRPSYRESAILLTNIIISSSQQNNLLLLDHDHVFVDIFTTKGSGEHVDRTLQATLKIRRLGPLVHTQEGGRAFWVTDQSVEVPLSMQHVSFAVAMEDPKYSSSKLGNVEKDMDAILSISLKEGLVSVSNLAGISGWNSGYILGFTCVVMPRNELTLSADNAHRKLAIVDEREQQIDDWLECEADKLPRLHKLGAFFYQRFMRTQDIPDIEMTIAYQGELLKWTPDGHPDKPSRLNNLGSSLSHRFERFGDLNDINKSILIFENAVQLTPDGHPDKPSPLNNLGISLFRRFERHGDLDHINKSILMFENTVQLTPNGHPDKPSRLNNLGNSLLSRFERHGDLNDINKSILIFENTVQMTPNGHPDKPSKLNNIGKSLLSRFERLGDLNDINKSILMFENAMRLTPDDHPTKPTMLNDLGSSLLSRFERFGDLNDVNNSILMFESAMPLTPDGHPDKPSSLNNLGNSLFRRFERLGDLHDINRSVFMKENAVQLAPDGHPDMPTFLNNLGNSLLSRFEQFGNGEDQIHSMKCYSSAALTTTGHPLVKFHASSLWARLAEQLEDSSRRDAYSTALTLLPQLAWLGSPVQDRHSYVKEAGSVVRHAAVAAIEDDNLITAVEWLEQGRSIIWGQLLHLRLPIDDLISLYPAHGQQLHSLSLMLEGVNLSQKSLTSSSSTSHISPDYHGIAHERALLINEIRQLPGFEHFLLPKPLSELTRVAQLGPVVMLNTTEKRCDALVLVPGLDDDVLHIPLPDISLAQVNALHHNLHQLVQGDGRTIDMLSQSFRGDMERLGIILLSQGSDSSYHERRDKVFQTMLSIMWDRIVKPIVQGLALTTHSLSRIWWCPTGSFSFLPLHAAGNYSGDAAFGSKLTDYAISSYIPSLTSLIQALDSVPEIVPKAPRVLVVAQSSATGQTHLPGTLRKLKLIEGLATKNKNITIVSLNESDATVSRVKEEMENASWAHFACHGVQDSEKPTDSALLLSGSSRLMLSEIIGMKLPSKDFAFLSACQTGTGDKDLSDESVHLAAGMLSAGYRGVIATMWSISDLHAPTVANDVYAHLFKKREPDSTDAAEALYYAVKNLQGKPGVSTLEWVPFIHMGL